MVVEFPSQRGTVHAVSDVSLDLVDRETLGIVGESGCGKSTTGKAIMRVPPPTSGRVLLDGVDLSSLDTEEMRQVRGQPADDLPGRHLVAEPAAPDPRGRRPSRS